MPVRRMSRSRRGFQGRRRQREWARYNNNTSLIGATNDTAAFDITSDFRTAGGDIHGATVVDVRFAYKTVVVDSGAPGNRVTDYLFCGLIVGDYEASADVPTPGNSPHADWMWYETIWGNAAGATSAGSGNVSTTNSSYTSDRHIRARRRLDELQDKIWLVFEAVSASPTATQTIGFTTSTLLLLP